MDRIKIIIVDDHQIVRDGIKAMLANDASISIVAEASCGQTLEKSIVQESPDVVLMDISLPGKSGIELCKDLLKSHEHIKILILSMYMSEEFILSAIEAGAKGYLPKNTSKSELISAIHALYNGDDYYSDEVSNIILKSYVNNIKQKQASQEIAETLSKREIEILKMFAEGLTNQEIAEGLFISIRTVESHKNHIMQKLNIRTTVDLIKYAIRNNIVAL